MSFTTAVQDWTHNEIISIKQTAQNLCLLDLISLCLGHVVYKQLRGKKREKNRW